MMCFGSANGAYRMIAKKGEGTFSEVLKAQCIKTSKYVAIKCMKNTFDNLDQVTNLREIQALQRLSPHPNIIKLLEAMFDPPSGRLALVFELMDMNIYELIRGRRTYVAEDRIKCYMYQLLKAMDHMHRNGIFHRDIKPENILIMDESLKLADFGSCRGVHSKQPYTEYISTRWYRAPECLLTDGYYSYKMDMWGVGCVFFEVISLFPLFPGTNELDQIQKIHKVLGTPPQQLFDRMKRRSQHADFKFPQQDGTGIARLIPHAPPACVELLNKLLAYNPDDRISARQALRHPYFKDLREREKLQQAFANASRCTSLRPSPRMIMPELAGLNKSKEEDVKTHITEKIGTFRNPSTASTPQSICSSVQLPTISASNRIKEDGKDTRTSSPLSLGDTRTPATLLSCGSTVALHRTMETTKMHMDIEVTSDASSVYPHHKSGHVFSVSPAKQKLLSEQPSFQYPANSYTTKAHTMKTTKILKGSKGHRVLPEVSSKNVGGYRTGDQPPYKKRASNTKYTSPYSHKYISQLTAMCHD